MPNPIYVQRDDLDVFRIEPQDPSRPEPSQPWTATTGTWVTVEPTFCRLLGDIGMANYAQKIFEGWSAGYDTSMENPLKVGRDLISHTTLRYRQAMRRHEGSLPLAEFSSYVPMRFSVQDEVFAMNPLFPYRSNVADTWLVSSNTSYAVGPLDEALQEAGYHVVQGSSAEELRDRWSQLSYGEENVPVHYVAKDALPTGVVFPVENPTLCKPYGEHQNAYAFRFQFYNGPIFAIAKDRYPSRAMYMECTDGWGIRGTWNQLWEALHLTEEVGESLAHAQALSRNAGNLLHFRLKMFPPKHAKSAVCGAKERAEAIVFDPLRTWMQFILELDGIGMVNHLSALKEGLVAEVVEAADMRLLTTLRNAEHAVPAYALLGIPVDPKLFDSLKSLVTRGWVREWNRDGEMRYYTEPSARPLLNKLFAEVSVG